MHLQHAHCYNWLHNIYTQNHRKYAHHGGFHLIATATANHEIALKIASSTVAKVLPTEDVISYMKNDFVTGEPGAVKGTHCPDGRKEG